MRKDGKTWWWWFCNLFGPQGPGIEYPDLGLPGDGKDRVT